MPFDALFKESADPRLSFPRMYHNSDANLMRIARCAIADQRNWIRKAFRVCRPTWDRDMVCPLQAIWDVCGDDRAARRRLTKAFSKHMPLALRPMNLISRRSTIIIYNDYICDHASLMARFDCTIRYLDRTNPQYA